MGENRTANAAEAALAQVADAIRKSINEWESNTGMQVERVDLERVEIGEPGGAKAHILHVTCLAVLAGGAG